MRATLFLPIAAAAILAAPSESQADDFQRGTVVMRDGRTFKDVKYKVRGKYVTVRRRYGDIPYHMRDIKRLIPASGDTEAAEDAGPTNVDWHARFKLTPPEGWDAAKPTNPLVRVMLRHEERDATLSVTVRPVEGTGWSRPKKNSWGSYGVPEDVPRSIQKDMKVLYASQPHVGVGVGSLHTCPVYRVNRYEAQTYRHKTARAQTEIRVQRFGLEYAITYSVASKDEGALKHTIDAVLASFSFLPAMSVEKGFYSDYLRGFSLKNPFETWTLRASPFSESRPLKVQTTDGRGEITVRVLSGDDPQRAVEAMVAERRRKNPRHFSKNKVWQSKQDGSVVTRFRFRDFRSGQTKLLQFRGFAWKVGEKTMLLTGIAPLSDDDARKIQGEVKQILRGVQLSDREGFKKRIDRGRSAMKLLAQGVEAHKARRHSEAIQRFDEAVKLVPSFTLAYYLRGLAKKSSGDFDGYKQDLEKAGELDPSAGYTKALDRALMDEAKDAQTRQKWGKALQLWARVLGSDSKSTKARDAVLECGTQYYAQFSQKKRWKKGVRAIEKHVKRMAKIDQVKRLLHQTYRDAATNLSSIRKFSGAKKYARAIKSLGRRTRDKEIRKDGESLLEQIKAAEGTGNR